MDKYRFQHYTTESSQNISVLPTVKHSATIPMVINAGVAYDLYMGNIVTFSVDLEQEFVNLEQSPFSLRGWN